MKKISSYFSQTWSDTITKFTSGITIIVASSILLAWIFYYWIAKEYLQVIFLFKPNTAICFILTGIVLWSTCEKATKQSVIKIGTAIVFLISFLTLFEYFFNINLGIDELIFKEPFPSESGLPPGRMTPLTAMNLSLLSFTLFFLDNKIINYRIYSSLIFIVFTTSIFEFLYHIYSFANGSSEHTAIHYGIFQMTFAASFLFILLSIGILFARPYRGFISVLISKNNSGKLARRLIPPAILLPIIFGYIFISERTEASSVFSVSAIVVATSIFISCLILINSYLVNKDENEQRRTALDLKQFQTLALKSADAGTWSWNVKKNILACDTHLHELFGVKIGNFPTHFEAIYNFIHPKDRDRIDQEIKFSILYNSEYESEFRVFHPDGSIHNLATRGHIFRDHSGQATKMAGICWDITQRKKVEVELRNAKETAERLAEEAGEANRAKSAFLAAMSHEIRTPLNGVMGTIELLYDTSLTQEQRDFIATMRSSGDDLLSVINDIIDYSKIESGRFELEYSDFNLQSLIDDTVERVVLQVHEKGLSIDALIDPNLPEWFNGDPSRIRQILTNLLNNASKFTDKGEISIRIKLLENQDVTENHQDTSEPPVFKLLFEVTDTGIGITPEVRERLFKPFSQGDFSNKRKHGGTGLGLVIAKRLVELLKGTIGVESSPGVGSKFWFTIPLNPCLVKVIEKTYEVPDAYRDMKILCVDDNPISREIMQRQIKSWKLHCDVSPNAGHALSLLIKSSEANMPYSLALVDYSMPGMNGLELIKIIRRLNEIDQTNIIILSPTGASFGIEEMKTLRIIMCLTKPLRQKALYEGVMTALQMIQSHQGPISFITQMHENKDLAILLAEDNLTNRQVASRILNKLGYTADAVTNGLEVLEAIKKKQYDLILMDCQMPEMDGYTATQEIRKLEEKGDKHIFIIAMTAHALKGDRQKCLQAGMDDYISKPIEVAVLAATLQRWQGSVDIAQKSPDEVLESNNTSTQETSNTIDMARIHEIFDDDKQAICQFLKSFIEETSILLTELNEAITNKNTILAKDLFHRLKGSAGNSGVPQIQQLSLEGENKVSQSDWEGAHQVYDMIIASFDKTKIEIEGIITTNGI